MKQMLLVLFVACSMLLQAQTFMVNDFESSAIGSDGGGCKVPWSGTVVVAANPVVNAVNPSANVLQLTNNGWPPVAFPITLPAGKTWADYDGVRVKLCPLAGADLGYANLEIGLNANTWSHNSVGTGNAWSTANLNTWYSADIAFDQAKLTGDLDSIPVPTYLTIKYNKAAGYDVLIDDVQLIEHQDPTREVTLSFEDQILGTAAGIGFWYPNSGWGEVGVVANPVTNGINTSSKALEVTWPATGGGAIAVNILPANGDWHNYDYVSFKVLATAYDVSNPWSAVFVGGGPDVWTGGSSQWNDTLGVYDLNKWYNVIIPIGSVKNSAQPYLNIQANSGVTYLLDDISLMKNSTAVKSVTASTLKIARVSASQYQVSIGSASSYKLLNMEGREIKSGILVAGSNILHMADLASGIYLLKTTSSIEKNVVKIIK